MPKNYKEPMAEGLLAGERPKAKSNFAASCSNFSIQYNLAVASVSLHLVTLTPGYQFWCLLYGLFHTCTLLTVLISFFICVRVCVRACVRACMRMCMRERIYVYVCCVLTL